MQPFPAPVRLILITEEASMRLLRILAVATVLATFAPLLSAAASRSDDAFVKDTRAWLNKLEKLGFAGVVLVEKDGNVLVAEGCGLSDRERHTEWSTKTICDIGSITKQFTATAILRLEEQGKLATTDPLSTHFTDVPDDKRDITLHQLLTHTSGIIDLEKADDYDPIERDEFMRRIFAQPLNSAPGDKYAYSNAGYSILGAIIEKTTGQSWEPFVRALLFLPQKMKDTGYIIPKWDDRRVVRGYAENGPWGTGIEKPMAKDGPFWVLRANGGIHSTAEDMRRWADALLDGRVLSPASMQKLWTPYADEGGDSWYGYGWSIQTLENGDTLIDHTGGNGIFNSQLAIVPRQRTVLFMQTNVRGEMPFAARTLQFVAERLLKDAPYPNVPEVAAVPASRLSDLAGTYRFDDENRIEAAADGPTLRLTPHGCDAFAIAVSTRDVDVARCRDYSEQIHRLLSSATSGDFTPLADAYRRTTTPEELRTSWNKNMTAWTEKYGTLTGFDVVGTAMLRDRDMTLVRFTFENGFQDRAYVWDKDEHRLRGVSGLGMSRDVLLLPVAGGQFASWEPHSGDSRPFQFETQSGRPVLHITAGPQTYVATRAQ